jgi:protein TonB
VSIISNGPVLETIMFSALETAWDQSARRRWTTAASFTMQALGISFLLAIPLLTVQGPPGLEWIASRRFLAPPPAPAPTDPQHAQDGSHQSNYSSGILVQPPTIPHGTSQVNDTDIPAAPDFGDIGVPGGTGTGGRGVPRSIGDPNAFAPPPPPSAQARPLRVSHWTEGNLVYRVQPSYPMIARQARIQGSVQLRAIISKNGTIENLTVISGHAMLINSAIEAVKQWRYRPYLLNGEPIEVETEVTVNFLLAGG